MAAAAGKKWQCSDGNMGMATAMAIAAAVVAAEMAKEKWQRAVAEMRPTAFLMMVATLETRAMAAATVLVMTAVRAKVAATAAENGTQIFYSFS